MFVKGHFMLDPYLKLMFTYGALLARTKFKYCKWHDTKIQHWMR